MLASKENRAPAVRCQLPFGVTYQLDSWWHNESLSLSYFIIWFMQASENVWKTYEEKSNLLRRQFARGLNVQLIDKTRAVVKDLHSRVSVAIQAVDAISKRIEKIRDEELQPQLIELIQGYITCIYLANIFVYIDQFLCFFYCNSECKLSASYILSSVC